MAAQQIGIVTTVVGHVVAVNADGVERVLAVGDVVYADEVIRTADAAAVTIEFNDGGWFDLGGNAQAVLDSDVYSQEGREAEAAGAVAKVEDIQAAIEAGADPTQLLPPTAAGAAAGGAAGGEGGHSFVALDHDFNSINPEAGIPTAAEPLVFQNVIDIILPVEEGLPLISINDVTVQEPLVHRGGGGGQSHSGEGTFPALTVPGPGQGGNSLINGLGGAVGFGDAAMSRNDDGSSAFIDVTSIFGPGGMNFFGTNYTGFWINNNGNITFDGPLSTYTPFAITGDTGNPMIAAFFADVDTRGATGNVSEGGTSTGSNLVYYHLDTANGVITITWDDVGYFSAQTDLVNAFQLRIFSTGDGNFGFEFRYENVDWTTGAASGGVDGLGGSVAHAGWTAGDGVNYYELPQSGDQGAILDLENTSNPDTAIDGNWVFNVVGGEVVDNDPATTTAVFTVTLSEPSDTDVVISFTTADGSAISGGSGVGENDYGATSGTVTILAGQTSATIEVTVYGDIAPENIEQFFVNLTGIVSGNAAFADNQGVGTILDNTPPDALPVALDDALVVNEDSGTTNANLATNDTPGDGTNVWALSTPASNGAVVVNANGTYSYTPNAGYNGPDSFTYNITDADGDTDTATVNITVNPVNDPPSIVVDPDPENAGGPGGANDVVYEAGLPNGSAPAPTTVTVGGTFTVSDPDGLADIQSVTINGGTPIAIGSLSGSVIAGSNGTLTVTAYDAATGVASYSYTLTSPATDVAGATETDTFTLSTSDGTVDSAPASIVIDIVDDLPVAVNDTDSVTEDGPLTADGNVLTGVGGTDANTTDGVADTTGADQPGAIAWTGQSGTTVAGTYGTLTVGADGSYSYALNNANPAVQALDAGQTLTESFGYTLTDGDGDPATATLNITINGANDRPGIVVDSGNPSGANDVVYEAGLPTIGSQVGPTTVTVGGTFTVSDPDGLGDIRSVTINSTTIAIGDLGSNNTIAGSNGTLTVTAYDAATGVASYSYTLTSPATDVAGATETDTFTLSTSDGTVDSAPASIVIDIVDDLPVAVNDTDSVTEDGPLTADGNVLTGVGGTDANTTDGVADTTGADQPGAIAWTGQSGTTVAGTYGTLTVGADGSYSYALNNANPAVQALDAGQTLTESFGYTLTDGDGDPATATLNITINGANDRPGIVVDSGNPSGANDVVYEAGLPTIGSQVGPTTVTVGGTFTVSDPDGLGDIRSVTINSTTIAIGDLGSNNTIAGSNGTLTVTAYDAATGVASYSYTLTSPATDVAGATETDTFTLSTSDGTVDSAPASIVIDIVDDLPVAVNDTDSVTEDGPLTADGNVLTGVGGTDANTTDGVADTTGADQPGAIAWTGQSGTTVAGTYGTLTVGADGSYSYALNNTNPAVQALDAGQSLTESFGYTLTDGDGDPATATLSITINGANDGPSIVTDSGDPQGAHDVVYEAGLSNGSGVAPTTITVGGTFTVSDPDGLADIDSVTINGTTIAIGVLGTSNPLNTISGSHGTLTVTGYDAATGVATYSYTLTSPTTDGAGTETDTFTLTTSDGTATSGTASIVIDIVDDVPSVTLAAKPQAAITLDESLGTGGSVQNEGGAVNNDEAASAAPNDIGYAKMAAAALFTNTTVFGADGAAAVNPTVYKLSVGAPASGLTDTLSGQAVILSNNAGVIEGRTQMGGELVLTVSVDAGTGEVTVHQYRAVVHDNIGAPNDPNDHDENTETASLAANALLLEVTVTDGDGDPATSNALDLGALIKFEDDGPAIGTVQDATLGNTAGQSFTGTYDVDPGTDGLGGASLVGNTAPAGLTAGGQAVHYFVDSANPNVLIAYTGADPSVTANQVFKLTLQPGSDQYAFDLLKPLDAPISTVAITGQTAVGAGPEEARILSGDGTPPLAVLSGWTAGGAFNLAAWQGGAPAAGLTLDEVNGSTAGWGVGNNNFNTGDFMRFDFGDADDFDGTGGYAPPAGFSGPAVTFANFEFTQVSQPTTIAYVVHYVDGTTSNGNIALSGSGSATIPSADNTKFIDYIELYGQQTDNGGVKVDLVSLGTVTAGAPDPLVLNTTVTDGDGDTVSKPITVTLQGVNDPPTVVNAQATVSEEGLAGGIADSVGAPTDVTNATAFSGHMALGDADGNALTVTLDAPTTALASGGVALTWEGVGTQTLIGKAGGESVVTITIDNGGDYAVTLAKPLDHPGLNVEDVLNFSVPVTVSDGAASTLGAINVTVEDDAPQANAVVAHGQGSVATSTNLMLVLDVSGSMDDSSGVQGMTRLELMQSATLELLEQYDALGDVKIKLVTFESTAQEAGDTSQWMTVAQARNVIIGLSADGGTNYDDALKDAMSAYTDGGKIAGANNVAYFVSDGQPTISNSHPNQNGSVMNPEYGDGIGEEGINASDKEVSRQEWEAFLNDHDITAYAIGMGTGVSSGNLAPVAYDGAAGDQIDPIVVTDLNDLIPTLVATVAASPISGNVASDAGNGFGADGGHLKSITVDGVTYAYNPAGDGSISVSGGSSHGTFNTASNELTVTINAGGSIRMNMDTGAYTYVPPGSLSGRVSATVGFTLVDGDGDTASSTLTVTVDPATGPLVIRDDIVISNMSSGGIVIPQWALLANDTNPATAAALALAAVSAAVSGTVSAADGNVTFVDTGNRDGSFVYTTSNGATSDTATVTVDRTADEGTSGNLTGSHLGEVLVDNDDSHTLKGNAGNDVLIGNGGSDTLNGGEGNDILAGGAGNDRLDGGAGIDTATYIDAAGGVTASLASGDATGEGSDTFNSIENLTGSAFNDSLTGNSSANTLMGLAGNDILVGGGGNDLLIGGAGNDTMTGGAGADTFKWGQGDLAGSTTGDVITDFSVAQGDKLDIADLLTGYAAGSDPNNFVQLDTSSGNSTVVKVDVDGGGDHFQTLATLSSVVAPPVANMIASGNLVLTHETSTG